MTAEETWTALYKMLFARMENEELWRAMANQPDKVKHEIDDKAHAIITSAIAAEREACAKICESLTIPGHSVQAPSMAGAASMIRERYAPAGSNSPTS